MAVLSYLLWLYLVTYSGCTVLTEGCTVQCSTWWTLTLTLTLTPTPTPTPTQMHLVDLAGSERSAGSEPGAQRKEARNLRLNTLTTRTTRTTLTRRRATSTAAH